MPSFNEFWGVLEGELKSFVDTSWKDNSNAALKDGEDFIKAAKDDLERWTALLAAGNLTPEDFEWLVQGKKDLAKLVALKRKGLSKIALNKFAGGLIRTVVTVAIRVFLKV
jgi:hypothetical protein